MLQCSMTSFPSFKESWEVSNTYPAKSLTNPRSHTMFAKLQDFTADHKFNVEASLTLANTIFASAERLAALNLNTARSLLEQSTANFQALLGTKDVQSFVSLQAAQAQPAIDTAISYSRGIYEIAAETKEEIAKIVEVQVADTNAKVIDIVDKALKSAPAGSETAVASIRTAIAATNSAYDSMNKVARKFSEITEANVAAAGQVTLKAAGNISQKAKKAA
jgi:phasin family protein